MRTLVIGHLRPDTDAIAAALGYAWVLAHEPSRGDPSPPVAARCGNVGRQTAWALERFQTEAPELVTDVAPSFAAVARPVAAIAPGAPIDVARQRLVAGERCLPVVDGGPLTPALSPGGRGSGGILDARAVLRALASGARTCGEAAESAPSFPATDRVSDHRAAILRADADDYLVVDETGRYVGVASRAAVVDPPRTRLVLVDHNELAQAVAGAAEAEIVEVLDHHRIAPPPTPRPIAFRVEAVGSTSTLVLERARERGLAPPRPLAGLLLSGLLSDTLVLRSPTSTPRDEAAAAALAERASVPDVAAFGRELLAAGAGLALRASAGEVVAADLKEYGLAAGGKILVAQVEVASFAELDRELAAELGAALERLAERRGAPFAALLDTDVVAGESRLVATGERRLVARLPYAARPDGTFELGPIVSRKKQLIPSLLAAFDAG